MRFVRLDPPPVLIGAGALSGGEGDAGRDGGDTDRPARGGPAASWSSAALARICGEPPFRFRRLDRYGALGLAAARLALRDAAPSMTARDDDGSSWGVMVGSSLGCWESIAQYHEELETKPLAERSPAVFARSVCNTVAGEVSIAHRLVGPTETFVSGWTAGAEAIAAAGAAIVEGRARCIVAGGVDAPSPRTLAWHAAIGNHDAASWLPRTLAEGAGFCVLADGGSEFAAGSPSEPLRLLGFARGFDPSGVWTPAAAADALAPRTIGRTLIANSVPPEVAGPWREASRGRVVSLVRADAAGAGAAGAPIAVTGLVREAPRREGGESAAAVALIVARGTDGAIVALALG